MKTILLAINAKYIHTNLAIRDLKAFVEQKSNFEIELVEHTINNYLTDIFEDIYKKSPDFIGISCYIWNFEIVKKLVNLLKIVMPNVKIMLGGPEVSYNSADILAEIPVDFVICGEGERSFLELLNSLEFGTPTLDKISALSYKNNGEILVNPHKNAIKLGEIPFPYTNFDELKNKIIYYEASRGCPFSCQYCLSSIEKGVRFAPIQKVKEELRTFLKNNVKQVKFVDRTFNANKKFATDIINFLILNDNSVTNFHFEVAADLLDDEMISLLKTARTGLFQLEIGVQSTNLQTLNAIQRHSDFGWISHCVEEIKSSNNIHIHLDLITGLPFEDYFSFKKSFNDVHKLAPHQLQLGFLKLLKGSGMENLCQKFEIKYSPYAPYEVLSTHCLPFSDVLKLKKIEEMTDLYYNSNRFENSRKFLLNLYDLPFDFYEKLAEFCEEFPENSPFISKQNTYTFLIKFAKKNNFDTNKLLWLIYFDMLLQENIRTIPLWLSIPHDLTPSEKAYNFITKNPNIVNLLPEYSEVPEKQLTKFIHIETFPFNPITFEDNFTTLLFNYRKTDLYSNAKAVEISL
ncbi:MAG: B12-binding domain-containing radical SAM protein [Oscillospiraceae bacterium]